MSFRDNFQSDVVSDVISGENVVQFSTDVRLKYGDSTSNRSRDIQLPQFVADGWTNGGRAKADGVLPKNQQFYIIVR